MKLISHVAFAQYMDHRGFTVRTLAQRARCSRATIGHLRSGARDTCKPATAKAVEAALQAPPGSLFVPQVSHVVRNSKTRAAA